MKQFLITVAGVLVGLVLFLIVAPMVLVSMIAGNIDKAPAQPASMVLAMDLREEFPDQQARSGFASFEHQLSTVEIVRDLEAAARDNAVKGLYVRANTLGMAAAQSQEVRDALAAFKQSGKFVIAHIQTDALSTSLSGYAAIAPAEELWLQETGEFGAMGVASETLFLGGFFEKYKMTPQFEQREEYKNAVNVYTRREFTPAHREAAESLVGEVYESFVASIAQDRGLTAEIVQAAVEATPLTAAQALERKLVTHLGRPEDAERAALERAGGAELVDLVDYAPERQSGPMIALVSGEGSIITGEADDSFFGEEGQIYSDTVARALIEASEDEDVQAIVFRVSSGGGSPVASDQILNAVKTAQANGKAVVVSMGEAAASGGYYIAAAADEIVASPLTITGSIGIFGGKIVLGEAMNAYLGVGTQEISRGSPAVNFFTPSRPFNNAEQAAFAALIDRGYEDFKGKVQLGRQTQLAAAGVTVDEIAKGRVWTGAQAQQRGLVDHLGGLRVAVERAKALAKIAPETEVRLKLYPAPRTPIEEFRSLFGVSEEAAKAAAVFAAVAGDERVAAIARDLNANAGRAQLRAEAHAGEIR